MLNEKRSNVELTVLNDCSFKWSLSSLIILFDYHQRVPTQIDWFILLKSVLLRLSYRRGCAF
ncbi:hypothetical protein D3O62_17505 [Vibrio cholerae]|nr:hypothetical protein [Vibrio cholerae]